jgi:hypothetical protein
MKTFLLSILILTQISEANLADPLKADFIDFSKLRLSEYVDSKRPDWIIERQKSMEDSKLTVVFIFEKKDTDIERRLIMQVFDLNGDNKWDLARHYRNKVLVKIEADLDYDGKVDDVSEYDSKTGKLIKKTVASGATNEWRYWYNDELRLKEIDRNNDKKPDMWLHYRKGQLVKTEVDSNFDGKQIKVVQ